MTAAIGRHVNATSRKRVEIEAYRLSEKEKKTFRDENLSQYEFLAALIFHESKNSEGSTIL